MKLLRQGPGEGTEGAGLSSGASTGIGLAIAGVGMAAGALASWKTAQVTAESKKHEVDQKTAVALAQMKNDLAIATLETKAQTETVEDQLEAQDKMHVRQMALEEKKLNLEREKLAFEKDKQSDDTKLAWAEHDLKQRLDTGRLDLDVTTEDHEHEERMTEIETGYNNWDWFGYT